MLRCRCPPTAKYTLSVGTAEFGNGTSTVHTQLAATELRTTVDRIVLRQSDTDLSGHDTGAFGSAGTVVAGRAVQRACIELRERLVKAAGGGELGPEGVQCGERFSPFTELLAAGPLTGTGRHDGTPRSVAFNVHGFRVAVDTDTGVVRILQSVRPPTPAW